MLLKKGSKGKRVEELQLLLNFETQDGIFGSDTEKAVIAFQKLHKLKPDGKVGSKTWEKLSDKKAIKIAPVYISKNRVEDFSDPEEQLILDKIAEKFPTSPKIQELADLILHFKYTRKIRRIIYHCTASQPTATVASIERYWKERLKWSNPGYHIIITSDGSWTLLQNFNYPSNGVAGKNLDSINVSYIGGIDAKGKALDTRTEGQKEILEAAYRFFSDVFPNATHHGHNEFSNKACPSFNVKKWIDSLEKI